MRFRNVSARWLIVRAKLTLLISWQEMFVCLRESRDRKEFNLRSGVPLFSRREIKIGTPDRRLKGILLIDDLL